MTDKIKTIIVDDEQHSREVLSSLLTHYPMLEIVGEAADAELAYELIQTAHPALVFLDIQMPRASGFTLLKRFDPVPFEVIFVTSFDHYAINAIRFNALDYLLKPVELSELQSAIDKATLRLLAGQDYSPFVINLLHSLEPDNINKPVTVHSGEKVRVLNSESIVSIEAQGSYCTLFTADGERYTTAKYLKDFEEYFGPQSSFVRVGKSQIINTLHIHDYTKGELCIIRLNNGQIFEVARRKKREILDRLKGI